MGRIWNGFKNELGTKEELGGCLAVVLQLFLALVILYSLLIYGGKLMSESTSPTLIPTGKQ